MTKVREIYKCDICGNVIEILHQGAPALVCCKQPMEKMVAGTKDEGREKHVPVLKETENGVRVEVGDIEHPMMEKHYIKFIEVCTEDQVLRHDLSPEDKPAADFKVDYDQVKAVREYCNLHGLWKLED